MKMFKKIFPIFITFILICLFLTMSGKNKLTIEFLLDYVETFPNDFMEEMEILYNSFVTNSELLKEFVKEDFNAEDIGTMLQSIWNVIKYIVNYLSLIFEVLIETISFIIDVLWWVLQFPSYLVN